MCVVPVDRVRTARRVLHGDHHTFFTRKVWQVFGHELRYLSFRCGLCLLLYLCCLGARHQPDHEDPAEQHKCQRHNAFHGPHTSTLRLSDVIRDGDAPAWTATGDTAGSPERGAIGRQSRSMTDVSSPVRAPVSRECTPFKRHSTTIADTVKGA